MPPGSFSLPLNIGTDIVHLPRIQSIITRSKGRYLYPFLNRILCHEERYDFLQKFRDGGLDSAEDASRKVQGMARWLGGRFAAKEAAKKAIGVRRVCWKDLRIKRADGINGGRPNIIFKTKRKGEEQIARLSISHDGAYVMATVIAPDVETGGEDEID